MTFYPPKTKSSSTEPLFNQLCLVEEAFQQKLGKGFELMVDGFDNAGL
jgi:hypothetical protein